MVVIFGWGAGDAKDLGEVAPVRCPRCRNDVYLHHLKSEKRVSLYFIPLVPYGTDEYLVCPICRNGLQVRAEQRADIERMRAATTVYRRGGVTPDHYQATVRAFWGRLGVDPSGQQVLTAPPMGTAPPPARPGTAPPLPVAPAAPPPITSAPAVPPPPPLAEQLEGLARLRDQGHLTEEEFAAAKRRLLGAG